MGCKTLLLLFPLHCLIIPVIPLHSHGHAAAWFQPFLDAVVVPVTPDRIAQEASSGIYKAKPQLHLMLISLAKRVIQRPAVFSQLILHFERLRLHGKADFLQIIVVLCRQGTVIVLVRRRL